MFFCYNIHGMDEKGISVWQKETEILSHALYDELMEYIVDAEGFLPLTEKKGEINYDVLEEEYSRVDMRKFMKIFPTRVLNSFASLVTDVPVFIAKKITQMIKIITSRDMYEFDMIDDLILWYVLANADKEKEAVWSRELVRIETDAYVEELGINPCSDEAVMAEAVNARIFKNLYHIYTAEKDEEIKIFFCNMKFKLLAGADIKKAVRDLCKNHDGYQKILASFKGTDMQPLFCQVSVYLQNHEKKKVIEFIEAEEEEMYESKASMIGNTGKIINFPLEAAFNV